MSTGKQTFAFVKPDAYAAGHTAAALKRVLDEGFEIVALKKVTLPKTLAEEFYLEHKERPFYGELVAFMTRGPVVALVLEKEGAVTAWRDLIGPTNSNKARETAPNSLRAHFGKDGSENGFHGSDSDASAAREIALVFPERK
jgi:nucleoside diphosphate kinase